MSIFFYTQVKIRNSASLLYTFVHFSTLNLKKGAISYNTHTELLESLTLCIFTYAIKILLPPCCAILQGVVTQFCISFEKNMHCQGCSVEQHDWCCFRHIWLQCPLCERRRNENQPCAIELLYFYNMFGCNVCHKMLAVFSISLQMRGQLDKVQGSCKIHISDILQSLVQTKLSKPSKWRFGCQ